jgi:hypothetical protein
LIRNTKSQAEAAEEESEKKINRRDILKANPQDTEDK